jgi:hypothetical protein
LAIETQVMRLAAVVCALAGAARADPCEGKESGDGPAPAGFVSNKPVAEGRIGSSKPLQFILDTGSGSSSLDRAVALELKLGLRNLGKSATGGGNKAFQIAALDHPACLTIAGARMPADMLAFDLRQVSSVEGIRVDGLIGADFFNGHVVVIDPAAPSVEVRAPSFEYKGNGIVLPLLPAPAGSPAWLPYTAAAITDSSGTRIEGTFALDTGVRLALLLFSPFAALHPLPKGAARVPGTTVGIGLGGESRGTLFRTAFLELGGIRAREVMTVASTDERGAFADPHVAGIIGGDFLRRYKLYLDYPHSRAILEPLPRAEEPFTYDASGLFLVADGKDLSRVRVLRVIAGSPAAAAGVGEGDLMVSIDGEPAARLRLEGVRRKLRAAGRQTALRISRGKRTLQLSISLQDLLTSSAAR